MAIEENSKADAGGPDNLGEAKTMTSQATASLNTVDRDKRAAGNVDPDPGLIWRRNATAKPWPGGFDQLLGSKRTTTGG